MGTYKKKGYKTSDKLDQQQVDESQSTTASVVSALERILLVNLNNG